MGSLNPRNAVGKCSSILFIKALVLSSLF